MRRKVKRVIRPVFALLVVFSCLLFASCWYLSASLPSSISYTESADMLVAGIFPVKAVRNDSVYNVQQSQTDTTGEEFSASLKLFGIIPVGNATVVKVPESYVQVLGNPFGIKIYADGVMVVGMSDVDTANGNSCPAKQAGLEVGDVIHAIDGKKVASNSEVSSAMKNCHGNEVSITITRNEKELTVKATPEYSVSERCYKLGIWVRDSSAGIGTLTFYDPATNTVAGLGHGITDSSTKDIVPILSGELVGAEIISSEKSVSGDPGELHGRFTLSSIGDLLLNCGCGVYGTAKSVFATDRLYPVAAKQEIQTGEAEILTTVSGNEPKLYACKIERIYLAGKPESQDMVIRITDPDLLAATGGIVQGMSGSPIIQNGKLVGAVTHVFVNNPEKGYAVFAENMLDTAKETADGIKQEAS